MEKSNVKHVSLIVAATIFLGLFIGNFAQYQLAAVPSQVYAKLGLTDAQFSSIMTAPMLPSIFLSLLSGALVDKYGIKKMVGIGLIISALGFLIRPFADSYVMMFAAMLLSGFGCMIISGNLAKIIASVYPLDKVGRVIGIVMVGSTLAMTVAYATTAWFPSLEIAFWVVAAIGIVVALIWLLLVKDRFFAAQDAAPGSVSMKESLLVCLKSKNVWLMGLCLAFLLGGAMVVTNFQVMALTGLRGLSEAAAGTYGSVLTIGAVVGTLGIPVLAAKLKNSRVLILILGVITATSMLFIVNGGTAVMYIAAFLNGALRSGIITVLMAYPVLFSDIGPKYAGTAGGLATTLELLGAVIIPTYVVIPLCGGNIGSYFIAGAVVVALATVCGVLLPNCHRKTTA